VAAAPDRAMSAAISVVLALSASAGAAVCAYADGALLSVDPDDPPADPALAALVGRRDRAHRALAFVRVALQIGAGAAWGVAVHDVQGLATIPLLALVGAGILLVVLSETTAREAGDRAGAPALQRTRGLVELLQRGPIAVVVLMGEWMDAALQSVIPPARVSESDGDASVERFRQVVAASADVGARENSILTGVFSLGDTTVAQVMTPRVDIVGIERDATWPDVLARLRSSEHARLVAYDGNLDGVAGVLYAKDVLPFVAEDREPDGGWPTLIRGVAFIPASKRVDAQLRDFRASRRHIAIVADEFGGTAGLVTIEDLLELIVGEIHDEYDVDEPDVEEEAGRRYWVSGRLTLEQLSDRVGTDLRHDDVATVGGLAYELFGRVPKTGESAEYRSWRFMVERVRGRRVERVFLERLPVSVGVEDGA
jgi:CBS domain containing-hemolysin-like protein